MLDGSQVKKTYWQTGHRRPGCGLMVVTGGVGGFEAEGPSQRTRDCDCVTYCVTGTYFLRHQCLLRNHSRLRDDE